VYQPQVAEWTEQRHMVAYAAVSYQPAGEQKPALGSLKIEADTQVVLAERLVSFREMKITEANFPTLPKESTRLARTGARTAAASCAFVTLRARSERQPQSTTGTTATAWAWRRASWPRIAPPSRRWSPGSASCARRG
jgi:hypothetical protein